MRALVQRVSSASVRVEGQVVGQIGQGLLVLLGVGEGDGVAEADLLAERCAGLRIFDDEAGRFNLSLLDVGGEALVISQFTLFANVRKGRRPSWSQAAPPELAAPLVEHFAQALRALGVRVSTGVFGATMQVALVNEGPVTIWLDSAVWQQPRSGKG
jgi:D-tyrosyl-tRNA(Tyr) deacylase